MSDDTEEQTNGSKEWGLESNWEFMNDTMVLP